MLTLIAPALYFIVVFGIFERFLFVCGVTYWKRPASVLLYFILSTAIAFFLFSAEPLQLLKNTSFFGSVSVVVLYFLLIFLAYRYHYFGFTVSSGEGDNVGRKNSLNYVMAKSADIFFQDTLAIIVILALGDYVANPLLVMLLFALYFFLVHSLLLLVFPFRLILVFTLASVVAGFAFAAIVLNALNIVYIFVLHWLFYVLLYPKIRQIRSIGV
jgi:hypothetical protein